MNKKSIFLMVTIMATGLHAASQNSAPTIPALSPFTLAVAGNRADLSPVQDWMPETPTIPAIIDQNPDRSSSTPNLSVEAMATAIQHLEFIQQFAATLDTTHAAQATDFIQHCLSIPVEKRGAYIAKFRNTNRVLTPSTPTKTPTGKPRTPVKTL